MRGAGKSITFKSIFGIVLMLTVFSALIGFIGYRGYTDALMVQYERGAYYTAKTAEECVDADRLDEYAKSGGKTEEYQRVWKVLDMVCNSQGATFVYVIQPDLTDYDHITFLFSTIDHESDYELYDFGYVRKTTNEEYKEKYRALYEGKSDREMLIRDSGYIQTDKHITEMIPLKNSAGNTVGILCVQKQLEYLTDARNDYLRKVFTVLLVLALIVIIGQWLYLKRGLILPVKKITEEAGRFARENVTAGEKLTLSIKSEDEIGDLAQSIDQMEETIQKYVADLTQITADKERIKTELDLANQIQEGMLPRLFPPFPDYKQFDLHAMMNPAKAVGGDFYDFHLLDEEHLYLAVADVAGKGIPAALFMMASKIILSDYAYSLRSPAKVLEETNRRLCSNNKAEMFVTAWVGILEISTGKLTAANAGHEYPMIARANGGFEVFRDRHGFVLGSEDGMPYQEYELILKPGDRIFQYTDGVTEAENSEQEQFGTRNLLAALNREPGADPQAVLQNVHSAVREFIGDAEQFDDLTMLCLEYRGENDG